MTEKRWRAPRRDQVEELVLEGCENKEIAEKLGMAVRTVKAHLARMYLEHGIVSGVKRVQLATLLYRRQRCATEQQQTSADLDQRSPESSSLSPQA